MKVLGQFAGHEVEIQVNIDENDGEVPQVLIVTLAQISIVKDSQTCASPKLPPTL